MILGKSRFWDFPFWFSVTLTGLQIYYFYGMISKNRQVNQGSTELNWLSVEKKRKEVLQCSHQKKGAGVK